MQIDTKLMKKPIIMANITAIILVIIKSVVGIMT